jgi:lipopolysaccharide biosynthesis glycosyltransferase
VGDRPLEKLLIEKFMADVPAKIFVGYDSREDIAWQVCRHSLQRHAGEGVTVLPLRQSTLRELGLYTRPFDVGASTEFSLTRFLTPYLAAQNGWAIFCDCDFLFTTDVREVFEGLDPAKALYCVQHDYVPAHQVKMDGKAQTAYPRKNWSSFMIFNCDHPDVKGLTPAVVNSASPAFLHRFEWIEDDSAIGALSVEWNFLEGEYPKPASTPKVIHYTNGGPWFDEWQNCDFAELWLQERDLYLSSKAARGTLEDA